jgi:hypothetical protein
VQDLRGGRPDLDLLDAQPIAARQLYHQGHHGCPLSLLEPGVATRHGHELEHGEESPEGGQGHDGRPDGRTTRAASLEVGLHLDP